MKLEPCPHWSTLGASFKFSQPFSQGSYSAYLHGMAKATMKIKSNHSLGTINAKFLCNSLDSINLKRNDENNNT